MSMKKCSSISLIASGRSIPHASQATSARSAPGVAEDENIFSNAPRTAGSGAIRLAT